LKVFLVINNRQKEAGLELCAFEDLVEL